MINDLGMSVAELFSDANYKFTNDKISVLSEEDRSRYIDLLRYLKMINENRKDTTTHERGKALEEIVSLLVSSSGKLFTVKKNVRTSTNEIDQIFELTPLGKILNSNGILADYYCEFLGECKNYNGRVGVDYVGKFFSLLSTCGINLGILFSYHGVTGRKWSNASGLIRKIYLQKEKVAERSLIISFSIEDFEAIGKGDNFLDIVKQKIDNLRYDTDITRQIKPHPAESDI